MKNKNLKNTLHGQSFGHNASRLQQGEKTFIVRVRCLKKFYTKFTETFFFFFLFLQNVFDCLFGFLFGFKEI